MKQVKKEKCILWFAFQMIGNSQSQNDVNKNSRKTPSREYIYYLYWNVR